METNGTESSTSTEPMSLDGVKGKFVESLIRNNKKIRDNRNHK